MGRKIPKLGFEELGGPLNRDWGIVNSREGTSFDVTFVIFQLPWRDVSLFLVSVFVIIVRLFMARKIVRLGFGETRSFVYRSWDKVYRKLNVYFSGMAYVILNHRFSLPVSVFVIIVRVVHGQENCEIRFRGTWSFAYRDKVYRELEYPFPRRIVNSTSIPPTCHL